MNSQELRALQEAYSQVYELDEVSQKTATRAFAARATDEFESDGADYNYTKGGKSKADETKRRIEKKHGKAAGQHAERAAHAKIFGRKKTALTSMPSKPTKTNEAVDLYDIILSHLLDEGYADTEQAAEAIMVNMSEDWRESIVEAVVSTTGQVNPPIKPGPMFPKSPNMGANRPYEDPFINPSGSRALKGASNPIKKDTKTA